MVNLWAAREWIVARRLHALAIASMLVAATACAFVACGGSGGHEATDGGSDVTTDAGHTGHTDASIHDSSPGVDHVTPPTDAGSCPVGDAGEALDLKCTGLYSDWATKTISADVQEFVPGLQLWSDGAEKERWIYLPPGTDGGKQPIDTADMDEWMFPVGTKLWKEFRSPIGSSTTSLESRRASCGSRAASTWYRTTYRWSADGETSATELTKGE